MQHNQHGGFNADNPFLQPTQGTGPLPFTFDTPGPTPLRTHVHPQPTTQSPGSDPSFSTFPSLLPATGTTLVIPPSFTSLTPTMLSFSSAIITSSSVSAHSGDLVEPLPTFYDNPPSSPPTILATRPSYHLRLPVAVIAAISGGSLFLLIVSILLYRWLRTPRRRRIPVPSLPKLENGEMDEKGPPLQESPLFGPKERFSQRPGLHPNWSWVTYPQQKGATGGNNNKLLDDSPIATPKQDATVPPRIPGAAVTSHRKSSSIYPASGHFQSLSAPVNSPPLDAGHPSLQQVQAAITRNSQRMSAMSFTCGSSHPYAKDAGTAFTADGHDVVKRRSRTLRKSRSNSVYEDRRRSSRIPTGLAYDGADVNSPIPAMEFMPLGSPCLEDGYESHKAERRTRIQTPYYTPGSYPRISSAIPTTYGVATRVKLGEGQSMRDATTKSKSDLQCTKETQALTRALGFASPTPGDHMPSPQPTLGPDDSLSIVESKRLLKHRRHSKRISAYLGDDGQSCQVSDGRRQHLVATPTRSVVAVASGSLVSTEDIKSLASGNIASSGLAASLAGPTLINMKSMGTKSTLASSKIEKRTDDKPPRVPSPPPLPSLTQMALEQHNPEAFINYRSPTYSIYNLYDDHRRSTVYGVKR